MMLFLQGCKKEQTYRAGLQLICDAPLHVDLRPLAPAQRAVALARWADEHVHNSRARKLAASLASMSADEQTSTVRRALDEAGIEHCLILGD